MVKKEEIPKKRLTGFARAENRKNIGRKKKKTGLQPGALTDRAKKFAQEYLICLNRYEAYKRAGYKARGPSGIAAANTIFMKPSFQEYLKQKMQERERRTNITKDKVLQELWRIATLDPRKFYNNDGSVKKIKEMDDDTAAAISSFDVTKIKKPKDEQDEMKILAARIRCWDKEKALIEVGKHLGMFGAPIASETELEKVDKIRKGLVEIFNSVPLEENIDDIND